MNELQIMVTVGEHPNVISLIGACTRGGKCREVEAKRMNYTQCRVQYVLKPF